MKKGFLTAFGLLLLLLPAAPAAAAPRGHGHGSRHHRVHIGVGFGWGWYSPWYSPWYGPYYGGYGPYYGPYGGYGRYGARYAGDWTVVDTDVSPEEARVYLDGKYIGIADDFDGNPDYLYLKRGRYRLEFRLDGFDSRTVEVDARPGRMLDLTDQLRKVPGARQYGSYDTPTPEGGVRRFWGKRRDRTEPYSGDDRDRYERYDRGRRYRDDRDDRDRGDRRPERWQAPDEDRDEDAPADEDSSEYEAAPKRETESADDGAADAAPAREERTRLKIRVEPSDAAVYLDDRFIGTAEEVASLADGVSVRPGKHRVTVTRPGMKDRSVDVDVDAGKSESVEVELER
jgi:hypothetical protein